MTVEFGAFKYASVNFPLRAQDPEADLLSTCDPTVAKLLDFFQSVLETYVSPALIGAASAGFAPIMQMVGVTVPIDPSLISKVDQLQLPILAVWRKKSTKSQRTANWQQSAWTMGVAYILPPLSAEQAIKLHPILNAVEQALSNRIHYGFDPNFNDGERIFLDNDIAACRIVSSEIGRWDVSKDLDFHGWFGELELIEQEMPTTEGLEKLSGMSFKNSDESASPGNPVEVVNANA